MVRLPPPLRKAALAVHLAVSVGWIGAIAAYTALDVSAATTEERNGPTGRSPPRR